MKILSIELIGYKRLSLNNIQRLYISFIEKVIFILGTNGSGKSSLLKELSALPAQSAQFEKTGSKVIHIEHLGFYYVLTSDFSVNKHRFLKIQKNKDGIIIFEEELNPGGTQTVQRELVKKEFGITQELHDLFTGLIKFHRMSVSERRKWFTLLSKSDYTYALGVYQKFKDSLRDAQVNMKMVQSRILQEKDKILSTERVNEIQDVVDYIYRAITDLKQRQKDFYDSNTNETLLNQLFLTAKQNTLLLNKKMFEYQRKRGQSNLNPEEIQRLVILSQRKIDDLQVSINLREKDLQNLQNIALQLKKNSSLDTANLKIKLEYLQKSKEKINAELVLLKNTPENDFLKMYDVLELIEQSLIDIFQTVQKDPTHSNTRDNYISIKDNIELDRKKLESLVSQSNELKLNIERFEHAKKHDETQCPKCQYVWIRNYKESDDLKARNLYVEVQNSILKTQESIKLGENKLTEMGEFFEKHRTYYQIVFHYSILKPLWDEIKKTDYLFTDPKKLTSVLENFKLEIKNALKIPAITEEIKELSKLIDTIEKSLIDSSDDLNNKINQYEEQIARYLKEQRSAKQQLVILGDLLRLLSEIDKEKQNLSTTLQSIDTEKNKWLKQNMLLYVQSLIELLESESDKYRKLLIQVDRQKHTIDMLLEQESELQKKIEALKLLCAELSPSEGLIAKGMMGFINVFLLEINSILRQIWLYPLELVVEEFKDDETQELDYKFKLKINGNDNNIIPDIQLASSSMKEVIDLSFQIVCMRYLGMNDYPLFLDEFGHSMDSAHRMQATKTIHELANYGSFSQIFIISHFENSYGTFKNAQMNVLCKNNIIIPKDMKYNDYMVIEN